LTHAFAQQVVTSCWFLVASYNRTSAASHWVTLTFDLAFRNRWAKP